MRGERDVDVLVVGAGPSGSGAAVSCAARGLRVRVIDRGRFPRDKVCGGCLSGAGVRMLEALGLGGALATSGATPLKCVRVRCGGSSVELSMAGYTVVERSRFDGALMESAVERGIEFVDGCSAERMERLADGVRVHVREGGSDCAIDAGVVLLASGLGSRLARGWFGDGERVARRGKIGISATVDSGSLRVGMGELLMLIGEGGYLGAVRVPGERVHLAAAVRAGDLREAGGIREWAQGVADGASASCSIPEDARWVGTPRLTRRWRRVARERVFLIGDAACYVEPLTGQGMTWALASGVGVGAYAARAVEEWDERVARDWTRAHRRGIARHQRLCRITSAFAGRTGIARSSIGFLGWMPGIGEAISRGLDRSPGVASDLQGVV